MEFWPSFSWHILQGFSHCRFKMTHYQVPAGSLFIEIAESRPFDGTIRELTETRFSRLWNSFRVVRDTGSWSFPHLPGALAE